MHLSPPRLLTALLVLAVVASGCGGGSSHHPDPTAAATAATGGVSRADAPQLKALWTAGAKGVDDDLPIAVDTAGDVLLVDGLRALTAISRPTGKVLWTRPAPCAEGTRSGSSVVVMQYGKKCADLQAVDLRTGKIRWTSQIQHRPKYLPGQHEVGVGRTVATVKTDCGAMERFDVSSGRYLGAIALDTHRCTYTTATDGRHVVVADRVPERGEPALMEYDADTGRLVWAQKAKDAYTELHYLVSADPLVLDIEVNHHRLLRRYDAHGRSTAILGRQLPTGSFKRVSPYGVRGGVLVAQYDSTMGQPGGPAYGWDLATGTTDWTFTDDGYLAVGVDRQGFLVSSFATTGPAEGGHASADTWIGVRGMAADDEVAPVGWIPGEHRTSGSAVVGDLLLLGHGGKVTAYRLPKASDGPMPTPLTDAEPTKGWTAGDVHRKPGVDPCSAVTPSTLRALGFTDQLHLPAPLDCDWRDYGRGSDDEASLMVDVTVESPEPDLKKTADDEARDDVKDRFQADRSGWDTLDEGAPKPVAVKGVGDEAWVANGGSLDTGSSYLLVRSHNVVVEVRASDSGAPAGWDPSPSQTEEGAWQAASDVFASLGLDVSVPASPADGTITSVRPACDLLRSDARRLVKGAKEYDLTRPGQQRSSGCAWSHGETGLNVRTYAAAPTVLSGHTADEVAAGVYRASRQGRPLSGLGDVATIDSYGGYKDVSGPEITVTARRGNLVAQVDYTAPVGTPMNEARADGVRLARKALAQRG